MRNTGLGPLAAMYNVIHGNLQRNKYANISVCELHKA
jgi:hypothetical protein